MKEASEGAFLEQERPESLRVLDLPEVRVSSASLVRIQDQDGRYALLVNKNRLKRGEIVLTPIGGAIEATPEGIEGLKELLGIDDSAFEKGNDLRFKMSGSKANEYRKWFLRGEQRETDPRREVYEELVSEALSGVPLLNEEELKELKCTRVGYATQLEETTRVGQEGKMTLRFLEIFDAELKPKTLERLKQLSEIRDAVIRLVTEEEIRSGKTKDGVNIGTVAKSLLDFEESIPEFV